jgi:hypothetical protein
MDTLSYWLARLEPLIRAETEGEIICVFANRTGTEEEAVYAGTSAVLGIHSGEVKVYGILGRGEKELLVVDTNKRPQAKLISEPNSLASDAQEEIKQAAELKGRREDHVTDRKGSGDNRKREKSLDRGMKTPAPMKPDPRDLTLDTKLQTSHPKSRGVPTPTSGIPKTMEEVITPLSPVDANSPSAYFSPIGHRPDPQTLLDSLKSSISQIVQPVAKPDSPTFQRPSSPKSRNASRNRNTEIRQPALFSHDLATEDQISEKKPNITPPLHSAPSGSIPFDSTTVTSPLSPRSAHSSPRPRSTVW